METGGEVITVVDEKHFSQDLLLLKALMFKFAMTNQIKHCTVYKGSLSRKGLVLSRCNNV